MNEDEKFLFKIYINFKEERKDSWENLLQFTLIH